MLESNTQFDKKKSKISDVELMKENLVHSQIIFIQIVIFFSLNMLQVRKKYNLEWRNGPSNQDYTVAAYTSVYENRTEYSCRFDKVNNNDPIVCKTNV
jgi:hypothetical protein